MQISTITFIKDWMKLKGIKKVEKILLLENL